MSEAMLLRCRFNGPPPALVFPVLLVLVPLFLAVFALPSDAAVPVYAPGDEVCVQWSSDWRWYEAQITEVQSDRVRVHYPEWGATWDEWVAPDTVNPRYTPTVGGMEWVEWNLAYYTATIMAEGSGQYQVHYAGYDATWDEWVNPCRIFPLPKVGDPVWVKWRMDWYYATVLEIGTNNWKIHYIDYDASYDEYVDPTRIMVCTAAQAAKAESSGTPGQVAPVPSGTNVYSYTAVATPVVATDAAQAKPVGVGQVASGGNSLSLAIELPTYASPIDAYFGYSIGADPEIYLRGTDGGFHPLSSGIVPMAANTTGPVMGTLTQDMSVEGFPRDAYSLYLLVSPTGSLADYDFWYTAFSLSDDGIFTGLPLLDPAGLNALLDPFIADMVSTGSTSWYAQVAQYIADYRNADNVADPAEARYVFMWASYLQNNVYPFCWAALKAAEAEPMNAWVLNSAAVCLLELGELDAAGRVLDYAHYQDAALSMTHENAAVYFDRKGNVTRAAQEKLNAVDGEPSWAHDAWDGYHYAARNGLSSAAAFDARLPSNYSLLKSNGSQGSGAAKTLVCCSCNGTFYDNVVTCVDECSVSLACFTSICTPRLQCCGQKTPFGLESGICFPPTGLQVCLEADNAGNYTVKLGAKLGGMFGTYVGASTNFKGNYNAGFSFAGSSGAKAQVSLISSDPNVRRGAAKFVWNPGGSVGGGIGFGANLEISNWPKSPICELNAPPTP